MFLANSELSYVPDYIKRKFLDDGWSMLLTDKDLSAMYYEEETESYDPLTSENVLGLTTPEKKTVFIAADKYSTKQSCVHEMGHYVDYCLGALSWSDEFRDAMESDRKMYSFYFPYSHLDVDEEFFAESLSAYWKHPNELASFCPNLYAFFNSRL